MRRSYVAVFLATLACYAYFFPRWADWNQNSRFDLIVSLVDEHSVAIDKYVANTGDYALFDGHYYSDKAPGTALLGVPVYALVRSIVPDAVLDDLAGRVKGSSALQSTLNASGTGIDVDKLRFFVGLTATAFVVGAIPAAALAVVLFWLIGQFGRGRWEQAAGTLAYALGTCAFPYANTLVGHQTAAFLLLAAFAAVFAVKSNYIGRGWLVGAGALLGYAAITEYPTVLIAGVVGLYALWALADRIGVLLRLITGAVPALVLLAIHDVAAFGTPLPVGYFHSALWTDVHQTGLVSLTYPHFDALWGLTFGLHRGLFVLSPYLLLAIPGYRVLWRGGWRAEVVVLAAVPILYLAFNSSSAMWTGGFGVGPRYLVAALPFVGLAAAAGLAWVWRPIGAILVAWSFVAVWAETVAGQTFPDYSANPLFEFSLPKLLAGDIARNAGTVLGLSGWASFLPLVAIVGLIALLAALRLPRVQSRETAWAS